MIKTVWIFLAALNYGYLHQTAEQKLPRGQSGRRYGHLSPVDILLSEIPKLLGLMQK